ncbi:MAG: GNAT family N-acetyltransferase [Gammaproteobacteria bacterium]|nr:GNAT family N-acetyltransferase [Gammaproteobacteria bacterium]
MREQPILESERLSLRPFTDADGPAVQALAGDERIADLTSAIPHPYPDGEAERWIATHRGMWDAGTGVVYAIILRSHAELIGAISVTGISAGEGELGYWIGVPNWGRGYASEAVQTLLPFLFDSRFLSSLYAKVLVRNPASAKVLSRAGFVHTTRAQATCGYRQQREPVDMFTWQPRP